MASSKSKKPAAVAATQPVAAKKIVESISVKTLGSLPALTGKLRAAFRSAFTDEQCDAWGEKTKAENVIREAEKFVSMRVTKIFDGPELNPDHGL